MTAIVVADRIRIPADVQDLESFRRWARAEVEAVRGWVSYLDGEIWVDTNMEQLFTNNLVKTRFTMVLAGLVEQHEMGYFFSDRMLLSEPRANLSTVPDGSFVSFAAVQDERVRFIHGSEAGFVELEGGPDMVLEVVSTFTSRKDTVVLRDLYWKAGVSEYWLVDERKEPIRFDVLRRTGKGYVPSRKQADWGPSRVFGRSFQLQTGSDRLGNPRYALRVKD